MLHVVYRVGNLEKTIKFGLYGDVLLCYSSADYGVDKYDIRIGFGHFGIAVDDEERRATFQYLCRLCGGTVIHEPGHLPGINTKITARLDPDGRKSVRLIARSVFFDNIE
ncbi:hypothetical protein V6N13_057856 [Hibiscus sabdariffa]